MFQQVTVPKTVEILGNPKNDFPLFWEIVHFFWEIAHFQKEIAQIFWEISEFPKKSSTFFGTVSGRLFYFRINRDWGSEECAHAPDRRDRWNTRAGVHCTSL